MVCEVTLLPVNFCVIKGPSVETSRVGIGARVSSPVRSSVTGLFVVGDDHIQSDIEREVVQSVHLTCVQRLK